MKNILGLDLGTNSIGWAVVSSAGEEAKPEIALGSRIIPMSQDIIGDFQKGNSVSQTKNRTILRSTRHLYQRRQLRRERLLRVLHLLHFLPPHFDAAIGWDRTDHKSFAKFIDGKDVHIDWDTSVEGHPRFLFESSFHEMLHLFVAAHPEMLSDGKMIPYDWTLYYLRKKALTEAVTKEELAWILLSFNQKRGYNQSRSDMEEDESADMTEIKEYIPLRITDVEAEEESKGKTWYSLRLENGDIYRRQSSIPLFNWKDTVHEFIVTTKLDKDGQPRKDKDGEVLRSYSAPKESDWTLIKKRTESLVNQSGKTVGAYIFDALLDNLTQKIRGKLVSTIDRKYYVQELKQILDTQQKFIPELRDASLLNACIDELYPFNASHRRNLQYYDFTKFFIDDILFYQRPLKSKKYLVANCAFESHEYVDKETGEIKKAGVKCIARSNPYFQEYRLWSFVHNLRIMDRMGNDVTDQFIHGDADKVRIYEWLNDRRSVKMESFLLWFLKFPRPKKGEDFEYRWNYVADKEYPANETRGAIVAALNKAHCPTGFLDTPGDGGKYPGAYYHLWHILYSVSDFAQLRKALHSYARRYKLDEKFEQVLLKLQPFSNDYGAYSEKAIKKLLPLMRCGKYWNADSIDSETMARINALINNEADPGVQERIADYFIPQRVDDFQGLPQWVACYVVYGRHSEAGDIRQWKSPEDITAYIHSFKQHSLRNPIVEQVVLETLRVVRDIWQRFGHIDEIHIELARELRNPANVRKKMSERNLINERRNFRIRELLQEMSRDSRFVGVRPNSPMQQDILKIYEEGVLLSQKDLPKDLEKIVLSSKPTSSDILRYKCWLEQKYRSPYTGKLINLTRLFSSDYQIEHIIPRARYFDDSYNNKVICEAEVNREKSNMLAHPFIARNAQKTIPTINGDVTILTLEAYEENVKKLYGKNPVKFHNLMADDIPAIFTQRQLTDSRYISRLVMLLLSNIVRQDDEKDATSKLVIPCTGSVTDRLKKDWGLNDVWNSLVYPRFERLNKKTGSSDYGFWDFKNGRRVFQTQVPMNIAAGFSKKRIDHRHHAMDALAIASATRSIVRYLNNENANNIKERNQSRQLLVTAGVINKPWPTFTQDAKQALDCMVVSFKKNVRIISKSTNRYQHYNAEGKMVYTEQQGDNRWAIRKSLHKDTVFGLVNLRKIKEVSLINALKGNINRIVNKQLKTIVKGMLAQGLTPGEIVASARKNDGKLGNIDVQKVSVYYFTEEKTGAQLSFYATRKPVTAAFDEKNIDKVTDSGIRTILKNRLHVCNGNPEMAFSPEGIKEMNDHIEQYNNGHAHQPIFKVRWAEQASKFAVGTVGCNDRKFVEADKGTNLFFAVYADADKTRSYASVPLMVAVEMAKQGLSPVPDRDESNNALEFFLSPNDLVYVPLEGDTTIEDIKVNRIYRFVSSTGNEAYFIKADVAVPIADKVEFSPKNKMERAITGEMIKAVCWKLEVDRLGRITKIIK